MQITSPSASGPVLGCIADDVTGATDLADALRNRGLATRLVLGLPHQPIPRDVDAVVVALKIRSVPSDQAQMQAALALKALRQGGVSHFYLKYCSTFDSTSAGNIGPVADRLSAELNVESVPHCPAYPENRRTVYKGYLFVGSQPLSESPMRHHPANPMTDSNLIRLLQRQTKRPVGLLPLEMVESGTSALSKRLADLDKDGVAHVIVDAVFDRHVDTLGQAAGSLRLSAGSAPFAAALGVVLRPDGSHRVEDEPAPPQGLSAVIVGSASKASTRQADEFGQHVPTLRLSVDELSRGTKTVESTLKWAQSHLISGPVLITADTAAIQQAQASLGTRTAARAVESGLAAIAVALISAGVRRLIVAGGETSGAVADALGLQELRVGPSICPGVPWVFSDDPPAAFAFKSGNFGAAGFFSDAFGLLDVPPTQVA